MLSSARPVRYIDQMPSLYDEEALVDLLDHPDGRHDSDTDRIMDEVIWTKSNHWAHEREWRLYAGVGETIAAYEDVPFAASELDGVIFGLRTSEENKATITDLVQVRYPQAEALQAKVNPNAYQPIIESLGSDGQG